MKKIAPFLILFIFFSYPVAWAEEISLTLNEALNLALRQNRDILLKSEDINRAKQDIREAKSPLYPSLNLTSTWSRNNGYYSKDFSAFNYQAGAKLYLYKGTKTVSTIKYNEHLLDADQAVLEKTKLDIILNVKQSFYTLILADQYASLNRDIVKDAKGHLDFAQAKYKKGLASASDILQIKSSMDSVNQAYESSLNQIASAQALLNSYLYFDKDVKIIPEGELSYTEEELVFDEALLYALKSRPELKQYDAEEKAAESYIGVAKSENRPLIYASWDYYGRDHAAAGTAKNWGDNNIMGITFSWPIFDGWAAKSKIEKAIIDLKTARLTKEKAVSDITLEFKNAYIGLKNAIAKIDATESDLRVYKDNMASVKERFKQGAASSLDLDGAVLKHSIARFNIESAVYDYMIAKSSLDKAMGGG